MLLLHIMIYLWYTSAALTWSLGFQPKSPTAIWSSPQIFDNYLVFSNSKTYSLSFSKYSSHLRWLSFYQRHNNSPKVLAWNLGVMPDFILNHCLYRHFKSSCPFSIDFNAFLSHLTYLDPEQHSYVFRPWANPSLHPPCFSLEPQSHPSAIILSWLSSVYTGLFNQRSLEAVKVFLVGFSTSDIPGEQAWGGPCQAMSTVGGRKTSGSGTRSFRSTILVPLGLVGVGRSFRTDLQC